MTIKAILFGGGACAAAAIFGSMLAYTTSSVTKHYDLAGRLSPSIVEPIMQSSTYSYDSNYDTGYYDVEQPK
jgi:hypothetical protein